MQGPSGNDEAEYCKFLLPSGNPFQLTQVIVDVMVPPIFLVCPLHARFYRV